MPSGDVKRRTKPELIDAEAVTGHYLCADRLADHLVQSRVLFVFQALVPGGNNESFDYWWGRVHRFPSL